MKSQNKGITLVALIITIVVLLILAAVTIKGISGEEIVDKAHETKEGVENLQVKEEIRFAVLKLQNIEETVEDKAQWLRDELNATVVEYEEQTVITYKGFKVGLDSDYVIQYILNVNEWDKTATPEGVFRWGSEDPLSPDYGTVTGYNAIAKNYTTLKYPSRCTKIMDCYGNGGSIGYAANIEKIEIPSTVVAFGDYAFGKSTSHLIFKKLKEVVIEKGVTRLGSSMFYGASELETVILPDGIKSIPSAAFRYCAKISQIDIPNSVTNIESYAFGGCTSLTELIIPDSVTSIGYMAFGNSTNIKSIVIPKTVVTMAMSVFYGWTSNQTIYVTFNSAKEKPSDWNASWANRRKNCLWLYRRIDRI